MVFEDTAYAGHTAEEVEEAHRALSSSLEEEKDIVDSESESDYDAAFAAAHAAGEEGPRETPPPPVPPSAKYALEDAVSEADVFESAFALFVYDPALDAFVGLYSKDHAWKASNKKLWTTMTTLALLLRRLFPERFTPTSPELVLAIGSGDYPQVKLSKLPRVGGAAPVFMFGSAFRDEGVYPNMVAMPMPGGHLSCFEQWAVSGTVCTRWKAATKEHGENGGLEFGEENGLDWDDLIPQLIWRGSDFCYLPTLTRPQQMKPYGYKLKPDERNTDESAIRALRDNYDRLPPRWKGVLLSAESELEARSSADERPPWADVKFPRTSHHKRVKYYLGSDAALPVLRSAAPPESEGGRLVEFHDAGIGHGEYMRSSELAAYKYQIDIAGGGGTTWTGTVQKLAMPGLLFHHVTPTKDYVHDRLVPWRHYVPVSEDLTDLRAKFDWAEGHPREARRIADRGAAFMRDLGTDEGFGRMFQEDFVEPLRRAIEAYDPVETSRPGKTWREALEASPGGDKMAPIAECSGIKNARTACRPLGVALDHMSSLVYGLHRVG